MSDKNPMHTKTAPRYVTSLILTGIALIVIFYGVRFLIKETNFAYYHELFAYLPEWLIVVRFCFSIFLRVLLVVSGIGIIFRINLSRLLLIGYSIFTIATIYIKHPLSTFEKLYADLIASGALSSAFVDARPWLIPVTMIIMWVFDSALAVLCIYVLTRKSVKAQFKTRDKNRIN